MRRGLFRVSCSSIAPHLDPVVFPHSDVVTLEGRQEVSCTKIVDLLQNSVTPERWQKMQQVCVANTWLVHQCNPLCTGQDASTGQAGTHPGSRCGCCLLLQVIRARSYSVVPVVEGLYDMGNLAAVCRSADGERQAVLPHTGLGTCCLEPAGGVPRTRQVRCRAGEACL